MLIETKDLIVLIDDNNFIGAALKFEEHHTAIELGYVDDDGNTLIHMAVIALINFLRNTWLPYAERRSMDGNLNVRLQQKSENLALECCKFIKIMTKQNISLSTRNKNGQRAFDLFRGISFNLCNIGRIEKIFIRFYETEEKLLYTGRKYVGNMNLLWSSKTPHKQSEIPDDWIELRKLDHLKLTLHQRLYLYENYLSHELITIGASNVVIANIGFLVSSKPWKKNGNHTRRFITLPISDPDYIVFTEETVGCGVHSEYVLCQYLKRIDILKLISSQLKSLLIEPGYKIYAIILDIHSTREVCDGCESHIHALQTKYSKNGFLREIEAVLCENNYFVLPQKSAIRESRDLLSEHSPRLPLLVRLSGKDDASAYGNRDNSYPPAGIYRQYNLDAKSYYQGVRLHLSPKNNDYMHSFLFSSIQLDEEIGGLEELYDLRAHTLDMDVLENLKAENGFLIYNQTAFVNGSAKCIKRTSNFPNICRFVQYDDSLEDVLKVTYRL